MFVSFSKGNLRQVSRMQTRQILAQQTTKKTKRAPRLEVRTRSRNAAAKDQGRDSLSSFCRKLLNTFRP